MSCAFWASEKKEITADVLAHRGQYAAFITIMAAAVVLVVASIVVLAFESGSADANISTGGDALWWSIVTLTTVGYGDAFPVTAGGRITAILVMFMGVGIIGALASILASFLVAPAEAEPEPAAGSTQSQSPASASCPRTPGRTTRDPRRARGSSRALGTRDADLG